MMMGQESANFKNNMDKPDSDHFTDEWYAIALEFSVSWLLYLRQIRSYVPQILPFVQQIRPFVQQIRPFEVIAQK